jgi:YVTN family beta-propeller protein
MSMREVIVLLSLAFACEAAAAAGGGCLEVIVSNEGSGDLAIVDPKTAAVTATIPVGKRPRGMALSADRERLFVALSGTPPAPPGVDESTLPPPDKQADGIGVMNLASHEIVKVFTGISDPERIAVSNDGRRLFVASEDQGMVIMLDADSGAVLARTPVGAEPEGVDLSPGGIRVYATSEAGNQVTLLDPRSAAKLATIEVGLRPRSTSFSPDGLRAYVANEASASISVIDTAALRAVRSISLPKGMLPMRIAVSPQGVPLYVSTGRGQQILAVDPRSGKILAQEQSGARPWDLAMSPDGTELYAANGPSNDLSIFELPQLRRRAQVHTGERPWGVVCRDKWWVHAGVTRESRR